MAIYKLFPEKDATLYTQFPKMNTGLDEILDASTYIFDGNPQTNRYLIKFSQDWVLELVKLDRFKKKNKILQF